MKFQYRVLNISDALEQRGYPAGVNASVDFEFNDNEIPENNGIWHLNINKGRGSVKKVTSPRFKESPHYGYGFWLGKFNKMDFFAMRGHLGQHVFVFPDQNIMIVRLGKRQDKKTEREIYPKDQQIYLEEAFNMLKIYFDEV